MNPWELQLHHRGIHLLERRRCIMQMEMAYTNDAAEVTVRTLLSRLLALGAAQLSAVNDDPAGGTGQSAA